MPGNLPERHDPKCIMDRGGHKRFFQEIPEFSEIAYERRVLRATIESSIASPYPKTLASNNVTPPPLQQFVKNSTMFEVRTRTGITSRFMERVARPAEVEFGK